MSKRWTVAQGLIIARSVVSLYNLHSLAKMYQTTDCVTSANPMVTLELG